MGKTSIISRYAEDTYKEKLQSTMGGSHVFKNVYFADKQIYLKFGLWDTAGQERFHSMIKVFYRDADAIGLVYSVTLRSSFEALSKYWHPEVKKECLKKVIICVVANKSDLYLDETVTPEEGKVFANSIGAFFITTSAKTRKGIDQLFDHIGNTIISGEIDEKKTSNKKIIKEESKDQNENKTEKCCK